MTKRKTILLLLRVGIAFAFLYPAIYAFQDSSDWIGYIPAWIEGMVPAEIFLPFFSSFEVALAIAILFMKRPFYPAIIAAVTLFAIVIFNDGAMDILFRDIPIALMAIVLAMMIK